MILKTEPIEELSTEEQKEVLQILSAEERARYERITHRPTALGFLIGKKMVRENLATLSGQKPASFEFRENDHGRPELFNSPKALEGLDFNLSHSRRLVGLGLSFEERIGIDLEPLDRRLDHDLVARRFFSLKECADLAVLSPGARQRRFLELWVLKEAWLKADGRGLTAGLHKVVFTFPSPEKPILLALPPEGGTVEDWTVELREVEEHLLGIARRQRAEGNRGPE